MFLFPWYSLDISLPVCSMENVFMCNFVSKRGRRKILEGVPSTRRYIWSKKHGIPETLHWHILGDTKKMRTNFCLLWNPMGIILPLVKMDVAVLRHEKSLKHQRHNKNAAGKQSWFHPFSWAVSQLKLPMTACWWNMIYNVHRHLSKLLSLLELPHRPESCWAWCWILVSKIKWSSWESIWDRSSQELNLSVGEKSGGWKTDRFPLKRAHVCSRQAGDSLDFKIPHLEKIT